ncbi:MAG: hypothetical protein Q7K39_03005 [Candidatus Magasanikbacteria bacterium]|nr:hypothetical protein [Candidatus Magasanikbacteria bacterium]
MFIRRRITDPVAIHAACVRWLSLLFDPAKFAGTPLERMISRHKALLVPRFDGRSGLTFFAQAAHEVEGHLRRAAEGKIDPKVQAGTISTNIGGTMMEVTLYWVGVDPAQSFNLHVAISDQGLVADVWSTVPVSSEDEIDSRASGEAHSSRI